MDMNSSEEDMLVEVVFSSSSSSNSEDSSDNEERRTIDKTQNFVEVDVPKFDEKEFKTHFRLSRSTALFLLSKIENSHLVPEHKFGREKVSSEKALLMCLWYLASQETFRQISSRFNVSTALLTIRRIVNYLVSIAPTYIRWPTEEDGNEISRNFRAKQGINGVIGAIDGSHIKRPKDQVAYCNRKGDHSIVLQAVQDND